MRLYCQTDYRTWWYFIAKLIIEHDDIILRERFSFGWDFIARLIIKFDETNNRARWNFLWDRTQAWWEFIVRPIFENERPYCETNQRAWCDFTEATRSDILTEESTCKHNEPSYELLFITFS